MAFWQEIPSFQLADSDVAILNSAKAYREELLSLIRSAQERIYITALYLQDDDAGREILGALHEASILKPNLTINILVDFHRAQRGLIGQTKSEGNAALYCDELDKFKSNVKIFGVPVKGKELFGVLHLKGIVIDDIVLYSGASINNVYLNVGDRYRLDRYFILRQKRLADSFCKFTEEFLLSSKAVPRIDCRPIPRYNEIKVSQRQLMRELKRARYDISTDLSSSELNVRPFLGFGRRANKLNRLIKTLFDTTKKDLLLYTPYFNFPAPLLRSLRRLLREGKEVTIIVGDKTANDFYIPPEQAFSKIGALPYLYETILHKFLKSNRKHIQTGLLKVYLWKHDSNSFHLKGVSKDGEVHLLSGHNLNPRAWGLDIENGILIEDKQKKLNSLLLSEKNDILQHCTLLGSHEDLQPAADYPQPVRKILGQAKRVKVDFIIKKFI